MPKYHRMKRHILVRNFISMNIIFLVTTWPLSHYQALESKNILVLTPDPLDVVFGSIIDGPHKI